MFKQINALQNFKVQTQIHPLSIISDESFYDYRDSTSIISIYSTNVLFCLEIHFNHKICKLTNSPKKVSPFCCAENQCVIIKLCISSDSRTKA